MHLGLGGDGGFDIGEALVGIDGVFDLEINGGRAVRFGGRAGPCVGDGNMTFGAAVAFTNQPQGGAHDRDGRKKNDPQPQSHRIHPLALFSIMEWMFHSHATDLQDFRASEMREGGNHRS